MVRVLRVSGEHEGRFAVLGFLHVVDAHEGEHVLYTLKRPVACGEMEINPNNLRPALPAFEDQAEFQDLGVHRWLGWHIECQRRTILKRGPDQATRRSLESSKAQLIFSRRTRKWSSSREFAAA